MGKPFWEAETPASQYAVFRPESDEFLAIGSSRDAALAAAIARGADPAEVEVREMTPELVKSLNSLGQTDEWTHLYDGRIGTFRESIAEDEPSDQSARDYRDQREAVLRTVYCAGPECEPWLSMRHQMLDVMAEHLGLPGSRVCLSRDGLLSWAPGVPVLHDDQAARGGRLSHTQLLAAVEMRDNLSDASWVHRVTSQKQEKERQKSAVRLDILLQVGVALYGPPGPFWSDWRHIEQDLGVSIKTMLRWKLLEVPIPLDVMKCDLPELIVKHGLQTMPEMRDAMAKIVFLVP